MLWVTKMYERIYCDEQIDDLIENHLLKELVRVDSAVGLGFCIAAGPRWFKPNSVTREFLNTLLKGSSDSYIIIGPENV